jgi:hypothetical protein
MQAENPAAAVVAVGEYGCWMIGRLLPVAFWACEAEDSRDAKGAGVMHHQSSTTGVLVSGHDSHTWCASPRSWTAAAAAAACHLRLAVGKSAYK